MRTFAGILFRRISSKTRKDPNSSETAELFLSLPQQQKIAIQEKLLQALQSETLSNVRHKIGDAVAEIARQYSDEGNIIYTSIINALSKSETYDS